MRKTAVCAMALMMSAGALSVAHGAERRQHRPMSHHEMLYGAHNHYYHHLHRSEHHHATAMGGPAGGIPHRN